MGYIFFNIIVAAVLCDALNATIEKDDKKTEKNDVQEGELNVTKLSELLLDQVLKLQKSQDLSQNSIRSILTKKV